jgi:hypothetical protein
MPTPICVTLLIALWVYPYVLLPSASGVAETL